MLKTMRRASAGILAILASTMMISIMTLAVAHAQDPVVVGPDIYKTILDNERVRVMEVTFKPGAKIGVHSHPDHLAYILTAGNLRITRTDGKTQDVVGKPGDVLFIPAESHSALNTGTTELRVLVVELKEPAPAAPKGK